MAKHPVVGLLGGGQLGRLLQQAAAPLGVEVVVLDAENSPAKQVCANNKHVNGSFNDPDKIRELAVKCDVLTVEIEHVDTEVLEEIATKGVTIGPGKVKRVQVHPSWDTIRLIQDKFLQKEHFNKAGVAVAKQIPIEAQPLTKEALQAVGEELGLPFMLKARKGSYDGRGNFRVGCPEDFDEAIKQMGRLSLYAEKFVPFVKELAVSVVRVEDNDDKLISAHAFPAVETIHEDSICTKVFLPPRGVSQEICEKARAAATSVVKTLKGRGVYAVEMFVTKDGEILVNELAPRPHNSAHLFNEAVPQMSQFKAQVCSILGIFPTELKLTPRVSSAIMLNILGGAHGTSHDKLVDMSSKHYSDDMDVYLHLYGKGSKPGRKIGHITVTSYSPDVQLEKLASPLIDEVNAIRQERIDKTAAPKAPVVRSFAHIAAAATPPTSRDQQNPLVVVTMGSDSDLPKLKDAFLILEKFEVPYDYTITSAHRTPSRMVQLGQSAAARGVRVLIAAAGGAAHLPGMLASETVLPVIGVPIKATHLDGHDSLLSIVQMPRGCPVATVGINNSTNAALLAVKILGASDSKYSDKMAQYMKDMKEEVVSKAVKLEEVGWEEYLSPSLATNTY